jgi:hypothetical protein
MIWLSIGKQTITSVYLHLPIFCKIAIIIFDVFQSRSGVMVNVEKSMQVKGERG